MNINQKGKHTSKNLKIIFGVIGVIATLVLLLILWRYFKLPIIIAIIIAIILVILMVFISIWVRKILRILQEEPFTSLVGLLFAIFILLPFLFNIFNIKEFPDIIKEPFSIIVPIFINIIVDGLFKIIEIHYHAEEKKQIVRYGATLNLLFNSVYISTYLAVLTIQKISLCVFNKDKTISTSVGTYTEKQLWGTTHLFTIIYLIAIILFCHIIAKLVYIEIKKTDSQSIDKVKKQIIEKKQMISDIQVQFDILDKDIANQIKEIENKLNDEIKRVDLID